MGRSLDGTIFYGVEIPEFDYPYDAADYDERNAAYDAAVESACEDEDWLKGPVCVGHAGVEDAEVKYIYIKFTEINSYYGAIVSFDPGKLEAQMDGTLDTQLTAFIEKHKLTEFVTGKPTWNLTCSYG